MTQDLGALSGSREPDPQAVPALSGFDPARDGPQCGAQFAPENGCQECWFCGRMLHAECEAYWGGDLEMQFDESSKRGGY